MGEEKLSADNGVMTGCDDHAESGFGQPGRKRGKRLLIEGSALAAAGGICWGCSGSVGQYLFRHEGMDSRWLVPIRLGLAGILLFFICLARYGALTFAPWKDGRERRDLLLYGLAGISACQFTYFLTIQLSSAGVGTILQDLSPVMILLVTCFLEKRAPRGREIFCILLAFAGVVLITTHGDFANAAVPLSALISGVICACCVTVYNMVPGRLLEKYPVTILQAWAFLSGGILLGLIFRPWTWHYIPTWRGWLGIAFVVIVGNVIAFNTYALGVKYAGPGRAILWGFSEPVTAAAISALLLGSAFTAWDALGFGLVFLMMVLIR